MSTIIQRSLSGGELVPALYSRVDLSKYQTGLRTLRNMFVMRHGGGTNRPGTMYLANAKYDDRACRIVPFVFSPTVTYQLEIGHFYIRPIRNGVYEFYPTIAITNITQASPPVVSAANAYANGDEVVLENIGGMTGLNDRHFIVGNRTAGSFSLHYRDGSNFDTTAYDAYTSGGTAKLIREIATPYHENQIFDLRFIQSADVMTITHPYFKPKELQRFSTYWAISDIAIAPNVDPPTSVAAAGGAFGTNTYNYVVTTVKTTTFEESLISNVATIAAMAVPTLAVPITLSWTAASDAQEYNVYKAVNDVYQLLGVAGALAFSDIGQSPDATVTPPINTNPFSDLTAGISAVTNANPAVVTYIGSDVWADGDLIVFVGVAGMVEINSNLYTITNLNAGANTFNLLDTDGNAVSSISWGTFTSGTINKVGKSPSVVTYYQQRLAFANTIEQPETIFMSRIGQYKNFTRRSPLQDDDAITATVSGRQVNAINNLIDLGSLISFAESSEWVINGANGGVITPSDINPQQTSYNGSNRMPPIAIGKSALYVQARGTVIRDLGFDFAVDGYKGNDLTVFSAHLFDDYSLVDWAYQQIPHSIVWVVRDDGVLLSLTYVREQELFAWARHDFDGGFVESVSVVPEGVEDALYLVIRRTIDGLSVRYVERMSSRNIVNVVDSKFMDSYLSYDGRHTGTTTMTLSGGTDWVYTEVLTLTASASAFVAGDVGNAVHLTGVDGDLIRATITAYTSGTVVSVQPNRTVPASMRSVAITTWAMAVDVLSGLWHLEGEDVSVIGDGYVVASPNNAAYVTLTVTNGAITLDQTYGVIHVGLPYISDIETLNIDTVGGETLIDKSKNMTAVNLFVEESRGIWAGARPPSDDDVDPLEGLTEFKIRETENYDEPVELTTDSISVNIQPEWNSNGRIFIRQVDPAPLTVLSIAPAGYIPTRG